MCAVILLMGMLLLNNCKDTTSEKEVEPIVEKQEKKVFKEDLISVDNMFDGAR